jgi:hypothetical protein
MGQVHVHRRGTGPWGEDGAAQLEGALRCNWMLLDQPRRAPDVLQALSSAQRRHQGPTQGIDGLVQRGASVPERLDGVPHPARPRIPGSPLHWRSDSTGRYGRILRRLGSLL